MHTATNVSQIDHNVSYLRNITATNMQAFGAGNVGANPTPPTKI